MKGMVFEKKNWKRVPESFSVDMALCVCIEFRWQRENLIPRVSHLTAPWSARGKTLAHAGHVSPRSLEMTI